jgi:hypothetical protein
VCDDGSGCDIDDDGRRRLGVPFNKLFETTEDGSRKFVCVG